MTIFTISYHSRNLIENLTMDSLGEIEILLNQARNRNKRLDVTGALIFNQDRFVQVLEGPEQNLQDILSSIDKDKRHTDIVRYPAQFIKQRRFEHWSMAFMGMDLAAQKYYDKFKLKNGFEWTESTSGAIADFMFEILVHSPSHKIL